MHDGREERFAVESGSVRFSPADDGGHTLVGRCQPGHRFYTLLVPPQHLTAVAEQQGIAKVPALRHSVSPDDAVLTVCMRTLASAAMPGEAGSIEEQEAAALSLALRVMAMNGCRGPDWRNDASVFERRRLVALVAFIDAHLETAPSLSEMAVMTGISPGHFAKKFRLSTGVSLQRFINRRRIRRSWRVLRETSVPLATVACDIGFASHSHFTRVFIKATGMSPSAYRQQFRRVIG